jgi:Cu+-exporting ATPase
MGCARKVERHLSEQLNVSILELSPTFIRLETDASYQSVTNIIRSLGYQAASPLSFQLSGLNCGQCIKKLTKALEKDDQIVITTLSTTALEVNTLRAAHDIIAIIESCGFEGSLSTSTIKDQASTESQLRSEPPIDVVSNATNRQASSAPLITVQLLINGMTCASCVASVEKALAQVEDVSLVNVNLAEQSATVYSKHPLNTHTLIRAATDAGYSAKLFESTQSHQMQMTQQYQNQMAKYKHNAMTGLLLGVPIMLWGLLGGSMKIESFSDRVGWSAIALLTLLLLITSGAGFYRSAYQSLRHKRATMDTLVALGTGAAWLYSLLVITNPNWFPEQARYVYFEASCMIVGLISLGHFIETKAKMKTTDSLQSLINLQPTQATQVKNNQDFPIAVSHITKGMTLRIKAGEQLPVDGKIVSGSSYLDESMLTGEPISVFKEVGDRVSAGTLNQDGSLIIKATGVGNETRLAKIIDLVRRAQSSKPAIAKLTDSLAAIFVPVVIAIALLTSLIWFLWGPEPSASYILVVFTTVLIIACPCALGLATPLSVTVGIGKAAEMGILIRDAQVLQTARNIDTVVFDKTGTLTEGRPRVQAFKSFTQDEPQVLSLLLAIEQQSDHPIAKAITDYATQLHTQPATLSDFKTIRGQGVTAQYQQQTVVVGSVRYLTSLSIDVSDALTTILQMQENGWTVVAIAIDHQLQGVIAVSDTLKHDAKQAIDALKAQQINVVMLTGDHVSVAQVIAKKLGITDVISDVLPDEKALYIKELQQKGHIVAMIGDGINDAPALSQADLSIAMAKGSDIAIQSAQITLLNNSPTTVLNAIKLSKATVRNIKQNLIGAFVYNIIGIPVAAGILFPWFGVLLNPMVAGAAMALSSITVVSNANRLRRFKGN